VIKELSPPPHHSQQPLTPEGGGGGTEAPADANEGHNDPRAPEENQTSAAASPQQIDSMI
jgi:hypothetical protein